MIQENAVNECGIEVENGRNNNIRSNPPPVIQNRLLTLPIFLELSAAKKSHTPHPNKLKEPNITLDNAPIDL